MSVSVLVEKACSTLGEGPVWIESSQSLLYVDIVCGKVNIYNTLTGRNSTVDLEQLQRDPDTGHSVGFAVPRRSSGFVVGVGRNLSLLDWTPEKTGLTTLSSVESGSKNKFNDAKCDASGRLWAGTMGPESSEGIPPNLGALYSLERDSTLKKQLSSISVSNGMAWSADNRTMYYIDSLPRKILSFDFDLETNQKVIADWSDSALDDLGYPDGMCIDADGKLWIACFYGAKVVQLDPETGTILQKVKIPARRTTSCCFGGPNYDQLFVTSSRFHVKDEELAQYPLAGSVFKVTGLGVKGLPPSVYDG